MSVYQDTIILRSQGICDIIDITHEVENIVLKGGIHNGIANISVPGSTGAITTIENESGVLDDLTKAIERLAPRNIQYNHDARWGDGNGFSHVRAALLGPSLSLPVNNKQIVRGTWQQIVFIDFDNRSRNRRLPVTIVGE